MTLDYRRKLFFPLIMIISSLIIVFLLAEFSLRLLKIGYGNAPLESHQIFHHVHPKEYRFLSHIPTNEYGGFEIYYDKNRLASDPNPQTTKKEDSSVCNVAFLGDSFTEATQVPYADSFVGILAQNSNCIIKNYGVSSYSPIFYLLQWRKLVKKTNPTLVVVQIYSNDISDDLTYFKTAKKNQVGEVIAIPGPRNDSLTTLLRKSYLLRFVRKIQLQLTWMYKNNQGNKQNIVAGAVEENPDISELSGNFIKTLAKEVDDAGVRFVFMVIPSKYRIKQLSIHKPYTEGIQFSDKWKLFAQKNNIPFLDLTKPFNIAANNNVPLFFERDIHFNENGHKIVASELSNMFPHLFKPFTRQLLPEKKGMH